MIGGLKQKVDLIASVSVMIFLTFGVIFFGLFAAFQLHNETVHIGTLATNVVSSNPEWLKTAMNYTGDKLNEEMLDNYAEQVNNSFLKIFIHLCRHTSRLASG